MSYEYEAEVALPPESVASLVESMRTEPRYKVIKQAPNHISLAYTGRPSSAWEADAEIWFTEKITVAVHAGSVEERDKLLALLVRVVGELGYGCAFDEL